MQERQQKPACEIGDDFANWLHLTTGTQFYLRHRRERRYADVVHSRLHAHAIYARRFTVCATILYSVLSAC